MLYLVVVVQTHGHVQTQSATAAEHAAPTQPAEILPVLQVLGMQPADAVQADVFTMRNIKALLADGLNLAAIQVCLAGHAAFLVAEELRHVRTQPIQGEAHVLQTVVKYHAILNPVLLLQHHCRQLVQHLHQVPQSAEQIPVRQLAGALDVDV